MSELDGTEWYEADATGLVADYERLSFETVHDWLLDRLPERPALFLDVGAGSGRDAAWLAARGHEVVAVDASRRMLAEARRLHPDARIRWLHDRLPGLDATFRLGLSFDVILASAVWMHVAPTQRARAFRKLITVLKPGGVLAMTLRHGPAEVERAMHPVSVGEIERLARENGAFVERCIEAEDRLDRPDIRWSSAHRSPARRWNWRVAAPPACRAE